MSRRRAGWAGPHGVVLERGGTPLARRLRTFDSLRLHRNYRLYFVGESVNQVGMWLQTAAQAWFVLQATHSPLAVGLVSFWQYIPYSVLGLFGGAIADRLDYRRTLIVTEMGFFSCAATLAVLSYLHVADPLLIYAVAAVRGMITVLDNPARQAFVLQMVGRDELPNAISLNAGVTNATRVVGPAVAGILIATAGTPICFALNAVSYVAVFFALVNIRPSEYFPMLRGARSRAMWRDVREGLAYGLRTIRVFVPLGVLLVISTLGINFQVMLPLVAARTMHGGAGLYGFITSIFGLGALAGALLSATVARANWGLLLGSAIAFAVCELVLAPQHTFAAVAPLLVLTGVAYTLYTSVTNTMVQLSSPDHLQGRVAGLFSYVFFGSGPFGALIAGGLAARGGTSLTFTVAGIAGLVMVAAAVLVVRREYAGAAAPAGLP